MPKMIIHRPYMRSLSSAQSTHSRMLGKGGSILLGGVGSASSYSSPDEYVETTGRKIGRGVHPMSSGSGLGLGLSNLTKKLESLNVAPKKEKAKNIRFNI